MGAINEASGFNAIFVGYSRNPDVALLLKPGDKSIRILQGHYVIINPFGISYNPLIDKLHKHEVIFQRSFDNFVPRSNLSETVVDWSVEINQSKLDSVASPFVPGDCEAFDIILLPKRTPISLTFATDEDYLAPFLIRVDPEKPVYLEVPLQHHFCKSWITWIHNEQPITGTGARDILHNLQTTSPRTISIEFCEMTNPVRKMYEDYCAVFDSSIGLRYSHMAIIEKKPNVGAILWQCLDGPVCEHWCQATFTHYNKNNKTGVFYNQSRDNRY